LGEKGDDLEFRKEIKWSGSGDLKMFSKLYKGFETLIELRCGILYIFVKGRLLLVRDTTTAIRKISRGKKRN